MIVISGFKWHTTAFFDCTASYHATILDTTAYPNWRGYYLLFLN